MNKHSDIKPNPVDQERPILFYRFARIRQAIFALLMALCLSPFISAPVALLIGLAAGQFIGNPFRQLNHKTTTTILQISVVGLGFGMNAHSALEVGTTGFLFAAVAVITIMIMGHVIGRALRINKKTSYLISTGTAICGGSAIAAIFPIIKADEKQMSVALGTVFILNAVALFTFPLIGKWLDLSQAQFGFWSAIAIHDTSSVVGASSEYGTEALEVATAVKLARTLWLIPLALISALLFNNRSKGVKIPYFIGFFILAILCNTFLPWIQSYTPYATDFAKAGMRLTLFLIGAGLSKTALQSVGVKPFMQGTMMWIVVTVVILLVVMKTVS